MKIRLSTLLLVVALACVIAAWALERRQYATRLADEVDREGAIRSTLSSAMFTNWIYTQLDELSEEEFAERRRSQLINNVIFLWAHRGNAIDRTISRTGELTVRTALKSAVLREAGKSLKLLGVSTAAEFEKQLAASRLAEEWKAEVLDEKGDLKAAFAQFVETCLGQE